MFISRFRARLGLLPGEGLLFISVCCLLVLLIFGMVFGTAFALIEILGIDISLPPVAVVVGAFGLFALGILLFVSLFLGLVQDGWLRLQRLRGGDKPSGPALEIAIGAGGLTLLIYEFLEPGLQIIGWDSARIALGSSLATKFFTALTLSAVAIAITILPTGRSGAGTS